jgi:hypothetical protein
MGPLRYAVLVQLNGLVDLKCSVPLEAMPSLQYEPLCPIFAELPLFTVAERFESLNAASLSKQIVGVEHVTQFVMRQTENVVRDQRIDSGHELRADIRVFCWNDLHDGVG